VPGGPGRTRGDAKRGNSHRQGRQRRPAHLIPSAAGGLGPATVEPRQREGVV
ncbi:MAG: hypothetical protein AVDCRST_MAG22-151, partial [uncultured Rubrobacteraceae bacterium]